MSNGFEDIYSEFSRLSDPAQQEIELERRIDLANPQLQRFLRGIESRLSRQGLFSASPVARATTQATSQFTGDITRGYFENLDERRMGLLEIIAQIESQERARKSQERSSLFGGIGSLIGTGLSFIPGLNPGLRALQMLLGRRGTSGSGAGDIGEISAPPLGRF